MLIADFALPGRLASRHILAIEGLSPGEITLLLDLAELMSSKPSARKKSALLRGLTVIKPVLRELERAPAPRSSSRASGSAPT